MLKKQKILSQNKTSGLKIKNITQPMGRKIKNFAEKNSTHKVNNIESPTGAPSDNFTVKHHKISKATMVIIMPRTAWVLQH